MRIRLAILVPLVLVLAGCVSGQADPAASNEPMASPALHVLASSVEPTDLIAPTFDLMGAVGRGGPVYGAGEPSIWAHLDGTLYLAFPGCDRGGYLATLPGDETCGHGPVYRSDDAGATWGRLNRDGDGKLDSEANPANGDNDVAVDAAGTVYASNLGGGGILVFRSDDRGDSWAMVGDVVPPDHWADRQWMAAAAPGHLIMAWMGGAESADRKVAVNTTFDGGDQWTGVTYLGERIGWLGTVQFSTDGLTAYLPFTQNEGPAGVGAGTTFSMQVARTFDGGLTWDVVDTGARITATARGDHWSGVHMAPALDVTGDGSVVVAWSQDVLDPTGFTSDGAVVRAIASGDEGATWSAPVDLSVRPTAIMPWVTGGAGDRFAVTYFVSDAPLDSDYVGGQWDVEAAVVDGVLASPQVVRTVVDTDVHQGGLCSRGSGCISSGSDRALLDFFESDLMPDGRLVVTYPADPVMAGKYIEIRVAVQSGGTPLFASD